jgi:hypothetical protein
MNRWQWSKARPKGVILGLVRLVPRTHGAASSATSINAARRRAYPTLLARWRLGPRHKASAVRFSRGGTRACGPRVPYLQRDVGARLRGHDVALSVRTCQLASFPRRRESTPASRKGAEKDSCFRVRRSVRFSIDGGCNAMQSPAANSTGQHWHKAEDESASNARRERQAAVSLAMTASDTSKLE